MKMKAIFLGTILFANLACSMEQSNLSKDKVSYLLQLAHEHKGALALAVGAIGLGVIASRCFVLEGTQTQELLIPHKAKALSMIINNQNGNVVIGRAASQGILVKMIKRLSLINRGDIDALIIQSGHSFTITTTKSAQNAQMHYEVLIPASYNGILDLTLMTDAGSITAQAIPGNLTSISNSGNHYINGVSGGAGIFSASGSIIVKNVDPSKLKISTTSGTVTSE